MVMKSRTATMAFIVCSTVPVSTVAYYNVVRQLQDNCFELLPVYFFKPFRLSFRLSLY
jgi:hypothetical protein